MGLFNLSKTLTEPVLKEEIIGVISELLTNLFSHTPLVALDPNAFCIPRPEKTLVPSSST